MAGCANLGGLYYRGDGVKQDFAKARELYEKACDGGAARVCYHLGEMYLGKLGVRKSVLSAKKYFGRACDLGLQAGCDEYRELNKK